MGLLRHYAVFLLGVLLFTGSASAGLRILTEPAAPMSFMQDGELRGFGVDVVKALQERTGHQAQIELLPWTRAYALIQRQPDIALFSMVRTPEREKLFQWVGPILHGKVSLYSLRANERHFDDIAAVAASGPLAVPKQWYIYDLLQNMGLQNLYGVPSQETMLTMFNHGRINLVPLEDILLKDMLAPAGLTPADVQPHMVITESAYYIAFSLDTDPALVDTWQQALAEMRRDGSLSAIFRQWLPDIEQPLALP